MFLEDLLHTLATKLFLHLKEAILHPGSENQCCYMPVPVTSEI